MTVTTNASGRETRTLVFKTLYGNNSQVLGRDLEYSAVYGRRVAFKEAGSAQRVAFDVDDLHPYVLAHLGLNAEEQKQRQAQQDEVWRRVAATDLQIAAETEARREAKRAAAEAARIEGEKQMAQQRAAAFQQEMQRRAMENDALRAEAKLRAADAAMLQALTPPPTYFVNPIIRYPVAVPQR